MLKAADDAGGREVATSAQTMEGREGKWPSLHPAPPDRVATGTYLAGQMIQRMLVVR